jgi:hypothetical protein
MRAHQAFNSERMIDETLDVYEQLVDTNREADNGYRDVVD